MKTLFGVALLVATAAMAGPARAADLPAASYYTAPAPLSGFSWVGPYLGANIGYEWGSREQQSDQAVRHRRRY